jgi:tripartite-type tricarboxylate transporter receptor subunit TctC
MNPRMQLLRERSMKFRTLLPLTLALLVLGSVAARAERPLSIVVGYATGGTTDTFARIIAARLQEKLGRTVLVENKPGATGQLGSRYVAKSEPDGSTIQIATQTTHAVAPSLYANVAYDPIKDFTPIILAAWTPLVLVSNPDVPISSVKELIEYVKARPGDVNYATGGRGDGSHLAALFFNKLAGITPVAVPFQGEGPALPAVLGNQVPYMFLSAPTAAGVVGAGQLRGLAVTSKVRASILPQIPTMRESGLSDYEMVNWWGFFGPAGMPRATVDMLNRAIGEILIEPATREKLSTLGYEITGSTPEEFETYVKNENIKWSEVIKSQGLTPN